MYIYKNLEKYFQECDNCGDCCKVPGVFIPEQIDELAKYLKLDHGQLLKKYLIVELCSPSDNVAPVFAISPVKADSNGNRLPNLFFDTDYVNIRHLYCIFRDNETKSCKIHQLKPFGCALLICEKMTYANSIELNKTYYHHKWKESQNLLFEIFPKLEPVYKELVSTVSFIPKLEKKREMIFNKRNQLINVEMSNIFNGHPISGTPIYS